MPHNGCNVLALELVLFPTWKTNFKKLHTLIYRRCTHAYHSVQCVAVRGQSVEVGFLFSFCSWGWTQMLHLVACAFTQSPNGHLVIYSGSYSATNHTLRPRDWNTAGMHTHGGQRSFTSTLSSSPPYLMWRSESPCGSHRWWSSAGAKGHYIPVT